MAVKGVIYILPTKGRGDCIIQGIRPILTCLPRLKYKITINFIICLSVALTCLRQSLVCPSSLDPCCGS